MRVVFLTQYYPPEVGAPQIRLSSIAKQLRRAGHDVEVVTALPNYPEGKVFPSYRGRIVLTELIDGVRVHRTWVVAARGRGLARLVNYLSFTFSCVLGLLRCRKPTHVLIESPPLFLAIPGILYARCRRASVTFNVADLWPDAAVDLGAIRPGPLVSVARVIESAAYRYSDQVTAATEGIRTTITTEKGVESNKVVLLPNGADVDLYSPDRGDPAVWDRLGIPQEPTFLFAGTQGLAQGLHHVIAAAQIAAASGVPMQLGFIGAGSDHERLIELADPDVVWFRPPVPPAEIAALLPLTVAGVVSLLALPTNEGARPSKLFPIMAAGRPVLYCGSGEGARLVEESEAGLVVANSDVDGIARAMVTLVSDRALGDRLGANGRRFVTERLSWASVTQQWLETLPGCR